MKIAVLGCGSIGQRHIRNLIAMGVPATDISGTDPSDAALAQLPEGVERYSGSMRLGTEVILICTPADRHLDGIRRAVELGIPFLCEKPAVTRSADLTDDLVDAADALPHLVGYNWRFNREVQALLTLGGDDAMLIARCWTDIETWPGTYGDPVLECSHEIDLVRWYLGGASISQSERGEFVAGVELIGPDGRFGFARVDWNAMPRRQLIVNAKNFARWELQPSQASIDESYQRELAEFLNLMRGHTTANCGCTLREAREVVRICEQVSHA